MKQIIREAAKAAGGIPRLADQLGVSRQAIYQWEAIPVDKVDKVARLTGRSRAELRPDLFGPEEKTPVDFEDDYVAWAERQADALESGRFDKLDIKNIVEEIRDMAQRQRDEIESRLKAVLVHLLKFRFQPEKRTSSWEAILLEQRARIARRISRSPSLRGYPQEVLDQEYGLARREAAIETGLPLRTFPSDCPFSVEDILDLDFIPVPFEPRGRE